MRFFIALEIPEDDKLYISEVQNKIKNLIPSARLTNPENLHLTIAFVGEQPDDYKDELVRVLTAAADNIPPFTVTPSYIDGFPHLHTAGILWIGVNGDIDKLYELRHHVKDQLENLELPVDERRFVPHIAIAKLKMGFRLDPETEKQFEEIMKQSFPPIRITSVKLFESIPNHGFHHHNTLADITLKA